MKVKSDEGNSTGFRPEGVEAYVLPPTRWIFAVLLLLGVLIVQTMAAPANAAAPVWHSADQKTASGSSVAVSVDRPDNVAAGDLIILMFTQQRSPGGLGTGFTAPTGFTLIRRAHDTGGSDRPEVVAFYKIATGSEPAAYTSTATNYGSTPIWRAVAARVTGHDPLEPIGNSRTQDSGTTSVNSLEIPTLSTMGPESLIVAVRSVRAVAASPNTPAGMTLAGDIAGSGTTGDANTNGPAFRWATENVPSQGVATGLRTYTWTNSARASGLMFEIRRSLPAGVPRVNGQFFGNGDNLRYPSIPYAQSAQGSRLFVRLIDGRLYVALVVNRSVNDMVFDSSKGAYLTSAGWGSGGNTDAHRRMDSEFAEFTLDVGEDSWTWRQGLAGQVGLSPSGNGNSGYDRAGGGWTSGTGVSGGSGTSPPTYVPASSMAWNMNRYASLLAAGQNLWTMPGTNTAASSWKSPWVGALPGDPPNPTQNTGSVIDPDEGYPGPSGTPSASDPQITFSQTYQWEWSMVYEWSVDFSDAAFGDIGTAPVFVVTGSSHHSPKKTGSGEDDPLVVTNNNALMDFGDLPAPYPTLLEDNGPRHIIDPSGTRLGQSPDNELDGQPHPQARGDDLDGVDDEDGIVFLTPLVPGTSATVQVTVGNTGGYLSGFIDFNGDGTLTQVNVTNVTGPGTVDTGLLGDRHFPDPGVYTLTIDVPANATGVMPSRWRITNAAGQGGNSITGEATSGEVEDYMVAQFGDRVWHDLNGNGIQDDGEPGLAGVEIRLLDANGNPVVDGSGNAVTTITDSDGNYSFSVPPNVEYRAEVVPPAGFVVTLLDEDSQGLTGTENNDFDPGTNQTEMFTLTQGQNVTYVDAGLYQPVSIGDFVWFDLNKDGIQDPGETGLEGVTVNLLDGNGSPVLDGNGDPITTTTDSVGAYSFTGLPPGTYAVKFELPEGYAFSPQNADSQGVDGAANSDPDPIFGITPSVTLTSGDTNNNIDAGLIDEQLGPPTAVVLGEFELEVMEVTQLLRALGAGDADNAGLLALLQTWDPGAAAALAGAGREQLSRALVDHLDPDGDGRVAVLRWETLEELGTMGFYVDRRDGRDWTRINSTMLPAMVGAHWGGEYWLADPGARPGGSYQYRLIEIEARGTTQEYGPFDLRMGGQ